MLWTAPAIGIAMCHTAVALEQQRESTYGYEPKFRGPGHSVRSTSESRLSSSLAWARANGKRLGRPPALTPRQRRQVHQDRAEGMSLRALARKYGTTAPTVRRVLAQEKAA